MGVVTGEKQFENTTKGGKIEIGSEVRGLIKVTNGSSWGGYELYYLSANKLTKLCSGPYDLLISVAVEDNKLTITNNHSDNALIRIRYFDF